MSTRLALSMISRDEAAHADRVANWAKTPQERLAEVEFLRAQRYPGGIAPRLQRVIEFVESVVPVERSETEHSE